MKKFFLSLVALFAVAVTTVNAREVVISGESLDLEYDWDNTYSQDGVTITCNSGRINEYKISALFTVTSDNGKPITSIAVDCEDFYGWFSADWEYKDGKIVWDGWDACETSVTGGMCGNYLRSIRITLDD